MRRLPRSASARSLTSEAAVVVGVMNSLFSNLVSSGSHRLRGLFQSRRLVRGFPRKCIFGAPEVAKGRGLTIHGPAQLQMVDHGPRREQEIPANDFDQTLFF